MVSALAVFGSRKRQGKALTNRTVSLQYPDRHCWTIVTNLQKGECAQAYVTSLTVSIISYAQDSYYEEMAGDGEF